MFDKVKKAFGQFTFLNPKDLIQIASIARLHTIQKSEHLFREGDMSYNIVIVLKGLLRHYMIDEQGEEKTLRFVPERKQTGMLDTIFHHRPAPENIIALEYSVLLEFDYREVSRLAGDNIRLLKLQNQSFKEVIADNVEQIKFLTMLNPEQRYVYFCNTYPNLEQRIKQKYLASFLGITPTSLSRMRARMAQQGLSGWSKLP